MTDFELGLQTTLGVGPSERRWSYPQHCVRYATVHFYADGPSDPFRATGSTAYLENGGTLENARAMAAHESPRATITAPVTKLHWMR
jgi:hypothetical protein